MIQKLYRKIARREHLAENTVHLVHYVVGAMAESYVPPPSLDRAKGSAYTAQDVCAAVLAYLRANHPAKPVGTLADFGIESSEDVGHVIDEMLFSGGSLNRVILGGGAHDAAAD